MRCLLCGLAAVAMVCCALGATGSGTVPKKKTSSNVATKKTAANKTVASAPKAGRSAPSRARSRTGTAAQGKSAASRSGAKSSLHRTSTTSRRSGKKPVPRTTWRNRQLAPTAQRYREIQQALADKGYLQPEEVSGNWNQGSIDALKKFQTAQNLEATGKINSLSLIALGLGPKRDTASNFKPSTEALQANRY
jgi:hypothetical protein